LKVGRSEGGARRGRWQWLVLFGSHGILMVSQNAEYSIGIV
jgi:hypothetical protein